MVEVLVNSVRSTLSDVGGIDSSVLSFTIPTADAAKLPATDPFRARIDNEILLCAGVNAGTGVVTVTTRAAEPVNGTQAAAAHAQNATVAFLFTAGAFATKQSTSEKNQPNGYVGLDGSENAVIDGTLRVNGNVGIATAPHATRIFHVGGSRSYTSDTVLFEVDTAIAISGAAQYIEAFSFDAPFNPSVAVLGIGGVLSRPRLVGTNGVTTPTTFDFYATYFQPQVDATYDAAITNAYGVWSGAPAHAGAGIITNYYGVFVDAPATQTNITNVWGVYVTAAKSYFGGSVRIDGNIGIGVVPTTDTVVTLANTLTPASGTVYGINSFLNVNPSAAIDEVRAISGWVELRGTNAVTGKNVTSVYGMLFGASTNADYDSNITNYYAIYAEQFYHSGAGTIGTTYGLFIEPSTVGTTNWSLYVNGSTSKSFVGGTVQINGNVGIGRAPVATHGIFAEQTLTPASGNAYGFAVNATIIPSAPVNSLVGIEGYILLDGTNGVTTPTITALYGMFFGAETTANYDAAITTYYGIYIEQLGHLGSGAITTTYGVYVQSSTIGVTNWGIYVNGSAISYFGGGIRIPTNAASGKLLESNASGDALWVARPFTIGGTLPSPTTGTTLMVWRAPFACTVTNIRSHFKGGTSVVYNARKNQASNHLSSNATNSTADAWHDGGAVQNTAYAAGDDLEIMFVTVTGAVTEATIQVDFTRP
jgi:hypothetical protein